MNGSDYLSFTKKERNGIFVLIIILMAIIIIPRLFERQFFKNPKPDLVNLSSEMGTKSGNDLNHFQDSSGKMYFAAKYGTKEQGKFAGSGEAVRQWQASAPKPRKKFEVVEINSADTAQFIALPFIGSKLASRIVLFRNKLGGFVSTNQLKEVYGIQDSVVQKLLPFLTCNAGIVRKIKINTADAATLSSHPYIRWHNANILVNYRNQHGNYNSVSDLLRIDHIDTLLLSKIGPYLVFD